MKITDESKTFLIMNVQKALECFPVQYCDVRFEISKIIPGDDCIVFRGMDFTDLVYFYNRDEWKRYGANGEELPINTMSLTHR